MGNSRTQAQEAGNNDRNARRKREKKEKKREREREREREIAVYSIFKRNGPVLV